MNVKYIKVKNLFQNNLPALLTAVNYSNDFIQIRYISKHWNPKFKKERRQKVIKVKLPNFNEDNDPAKLTKEKSRSLMREYGFLPQKDWSERPAFISCTPGIFESYVAPEGDGKYSAITKEVCSYISAYVQRRTIFLYNIMPAFYRI